MPSEQVAAVFLLPFVAEIPFWIIFLVCSALGMWHWLAGVTAFATVCLTFFAYKQHRAELRCQVCHKTFKSSYLAKHHSRRSDVA